MGTVPDFGQRRAEIWDCPHLQKQKPGREDRAFAGLIGRRPTLPQTCACSTIGAEGLNCRVRDGNGCDPFAMITQKSSNTRWHTCCMSKIHFMVKPNGLLVTVSSTYCYAYTPGLSTWSSSTALLRTFTSLGDLILGMVSRLYAFSAYPNQTSLPCRATGVTTGSQEVCSARSSRTKAKPPQISSAHIR